MMMDYNNVIAARMEHEARNRALQGGRSASENQAGGVGFLSSLAYRTGEMLETMGKQLKARNGAQPIQRQMQSSQI
jgi:hypothetical protein